MLERLLALLPSLFSTEALISALMRRDLLTKGGLLEKKAYELRLHLGAVVCVDGIPFRKRDNGSAQLMAIRRNTGPFAGKLSFVGGIVAMRERLEDALRRHFMSDLGIEIGFPFGQLPFLVSQQQNKKKDGWWHDPTKCHNIGLTYLVSLRSEEFRFGSTQLGGQEARDTVWFDKRSIPSPEAFAYGMFEGYIKAFEFVESSQKTS